MATTKAFRRFMVALMAVYVLVATFGAQARHGEIFPFFNWSLFSDISDVRARASLEIVALDGIALPSPRPIFQLVERFPLDREAASTLSKNVQMLGRAMISHDSSEVVRLSGMIGQLLEKDGSDVVYEIAVIRYDPIDYWHNGAVHDRRVLGTFSGDGGTW